MRDERLKRKTVLLTGCSSGIGLATVRALVGEGYAVWGTSRDVKRVPAMDGLHAVELNVNDAESRWRAVERVIAEAGEIDVLINNAGGAVHGPMEALMEDGFRGQMETLLFGPLELVRLVLPAMRQRNAGVIVNVSSLAARFPIPFNSGYSAAKAALSAATDCLRLELLGTAIKVVQVLPGDIQTEILARTRHVQSAVCAAYEPNLSLAHAAEQASMKAAPEAGLVARAVVRTLAKENPPREVVVGGFFEQRFLPLAMRILPAGVLYWGHKKFFGLKG